MRVNAKLEGARGSNEANRLPVILGTAFTYTPEILEPFIKSWTAAIPSARCWMVIEPENRILRQYLVEAGAEIITASAPDSLNLRNKPRRIEWLWRSINWLPGKSIGEKILRRLVRPDIYRHFLYRDTLRNASLKPETKVLLTDTRDVVFQGNPFTEFTSDLAFCEEQEGLTFGNCPHNALWGRLALGVKRCETIANENVLCAGTIFGRARPLLAFLERFCDLLPMMNMVGVMDQPIINWMARTGNFPNTTIFTNKAGPVLTMGTMDASTIRINSDGLFVRENGIPYAVVHQYDRHPSLTHAVLGQFRDRACEPQTTSPNV